MQGNSIFDVNTFLETSVKTTDLNPNYTNPDIGDYTAQVTDKVTAISGIIDAGKQGEGEPWARLELQWEIMDDTVRSKLNQEHVYVRQSFMLDLAPGTGVNGVPAQLDFGTNKNIRLLRLYKELGLLRQKQVNPGMLKFQSGTIHVEHRPDPTDPEIIYAEVTRVTSPEKSRARNGAA